MEIYASYDDEPETIFCPLTEQLYSELYDIEMDAFRDDTLFYDRHIPKQCSVLELGCGTGRLARILAGRNRTVTGVDISLHMLKKASAKKNDHCRYVCMDMRRLALTQFFDAVIIPYNTLNLLPEKTDIISCLKECRSHLAENGRLYLQIFIPDQKLISHRGKIFQFQVFNRPGGGKIIKEILRSYSAITKTISIEERYRIRPMQAGVDSQNWSHFFSITALLYDEWISLFNQAGFHLVKACGDYELNPFQKGSSSCLLVILAP